MCIDSVHGMWSKAFQRAPNILGANTNVVPLPPPQTRGFFSLLLNAWPMVEEKKVLFVPPPSPPYLESKPTRKVIRGNSE